MRHPSLTLLALSAAVASIAWSPAAMSFDGQKPTPAAASPGPSPMAVPGATATSTANNPTASPLQSGGIQANQLAADTASLDKLLFAAIEAGNPEEVRNALKSGVNLRQDFGYACDNPTEFDHNYEAEEKFFNISSPESTRASAAAVPGHCAKQHFMHALAIANKRFATLPGNPDPTILLASLDPEKVASMRFKQPGMMRDETVAKLKAAKQAQDNAFEVLALIDANTPVADKAFYPAYVAKSMGPVSPWIARWVLDRYFEALPEIKRARSLKEPSRMAWDAYKAKMLAKVAGRNDVGAVPYELAVFDPATIPGGDESYTVKSVAVALLSQYGERFQEGISKPACTQKMDFERSFATPAQQKGATYTAAAANNDVTQKYLVDKVDSYTSAGLAARPYSQFVRELATANEQAFSQRQLTMWAQGYDSYAAHSLLAHLLEKPEVIAALNQKTTEPFGALPPLVYVASLGYGQHMNPATVRAMLNAGVNPSLRGANGKTAADFVIGSTPQAMWRGQAFTKKELIDPGCIPPG